MSRRPHTDTQGQGEEAAGETEDEPIDFAMDSPSTAPCLGATVGASSVCPPRTRRMVSVGRVGGERCGGCPVITSSWRALFRENADCSYARSSPFVGQGLVPCRPSAPTQVGAPEVGWPIIHPTGGLLVQLPASYHESCEIWHRGWPCGRGQAPALRIPWMMARVARWMAEPRWDHGAERRDPPSAPRVQGPSARFRVVRKQDHCAHGDPGCSIPCPGVHSGFAHPWVDGPRASFRAPGARGARPPPAGGEQRAASRSIEAPRGIATAALPRISALDGRPRSPSQPHAPFEPALDVPTGRL